MAKRLEECLSVQAFMTDDHKLSGLNKKKIISSQCQRLEVQDQGAG